jgi:hypothetical protein
MLGRSGGRAYFRRHRELLLLLLILALGCVTGIAIIDIVVRWSCRTTFVSVYPIPIEANVGKQSSFQAHGPWIRTWRAKLLFSVRFRKRLQLNRDEPLLAIAFCGCAVSLTVA